MRLTLITVFLVTASLCKAGKLEKGFERLALYDFFKAKEYFEDAYKGDTAAAAFGLSSIFFNEKNPFFHLDSARRYILISSDAFTRLKPKVIKDYRELGVTDSSISALSAGICEKAYQYAVEADSVSAFEHYITFYFTCARLNDAILMRNATAYRDANFRNTSDAFRQFMEAYPEAREFNEAKAKFEEKLYKEKTYKKDIGSYEQFISEFPESPYRKDAERMIYTLSVPERSISQYASFARKYSSSSFRDEAWREVYKLALKDINRDTYLEFKNEFPDYPFMNELETDYTLANYTFLPVKKFNLWGFINEHGQEMVKPQFEEVSGFSEGLCAVTKDGRSGYINRHGSIVIPAQFSEAEDFHNGCAVVKTDSLYGLINRNGEFLIPPAYDELSDPTDGFAIGMKNGKSAYVAKNGKPLTPFMFDVANEFKNGFAIASTESKYGLIDLSGGFSIRPLFEEIVWIDQQLVKAENSESKWGILNVRGDTLTPFLYDYIGEYSTRRALVVKAGKCGFVNDSGVVVIPLNYTYSPSLKSDGYFNGAYQPIRSKGKPVLIDTAGTVYNFPGALHVGAYAEGLIPLIKNKKWGYVDIQNKTRIPFRYDNAESFRMSLAEVQLKKLSGVIDTTGNYIVTPLYEDLEIRSFGIVVKKDNRFGILKHNGLLILPCEYDAIDEVNAMILKLSRGEKYSYLNIQTGKFVYTVD